MQISKSVLTDTHFSNHPKNYMLRLICEDGFFVSLLGIGASVRQIGFPSRQTNLQNLALSFSQESTYFSNPMQEPHWHQPLAVSLMAHSR